MGSIPQFVQWCAKVGDKLLDDTIQTKDIIDHVLIPTEVDALPDKEILSVEWPVELLAQSEERVVLTLGEKAEQPLFLFDLGLVGVDRAANKIEFSLRTSCISRRALSLARSCLRRLLPIACRWTARERSQRYKRCK